MMPDRYNFPTARKSRKKLGAVALDSAPCPQAVSPRIPGYRSITAEDVVWDETNQDEVLGASLVDEGVPLLGAGCCDRK
jgi:hypothetical protein